jgi:hypothetical protein
LQESKARQGKARQVQDDDVYCQNSARQVKHICIAFQKRLKHYIAFHIHLSLHCLGLPAYWVAQYFGFCPEVLHQAGKKARVSIRVRLYY